MSMSSVRTRRRLPAKLLRLCLCTALCAAAMVPSTKGRIILKRVAGEGGEAAEESAEKVNCKLTMSLLCRSAERTNCRAYSERMPLAVVADFFQQFYNI